MKIRVKNYQSVKDISMEIDGFTVLVGRSNSGKTALLRAISGSIYNDSVIGKVRTGEDYTTVSVETDNVSWVWEKGKGKNDYEVTTPEGSETHSRVGFNVPQSIVDAGFKEVKVDGVKIRPQTSFWHDPIFLLNEKGKVITELISSATRLDVINLAQRKCSKELRKIQSVRSVRADDLVTAKQSLATYEELTQSLIEAVETAHENVQSLQLRLDKVSTFAARLTSLDTSLQSLEGLANLPELPSQAPTEPYRELETVRGYITRQTDVESSLEAVTSLCDGLPQETMEDPSPLWEKLVQVIRYRTRLGTLRHEVNQLDAQIGSVKIPDISQVESAYTHSEAVSKYRIRLDEITLKTESLSSSVASIEVGDDSDLTNAYEAYQSVLELSRKVMDIRKKVTEFKSEWSRTETEKSSLEDDLHRLMDGMGECPVCLQTVER